MALAETGVVSTDNEAVVLIEEKDIDEGLGKRADVFAYPALPAVGALEHTRRAHIASDPVDDVLIDHPEAANAGDFGTGNPLRNILPGLPPVAGLVEYMPLGEAAGPAELLVGKTDTSELHRIAHSSLCHALQSPRLSAIGGLKDLSGEIDNPARRGRDEGDILMPSDVDLQR